MSSLHGVFAGHGGGSGAATTTAVEPEPDGVVVVAVSSASAPSTAAMLVAASIARTREERPRWEVSAFIVLPSSSSGKAQDNTHSRAELTASELLPSPISHLPKLRTFGINR